MDFAERLRILTEGARYDASCAGGSGRPDPGGVPGVTVSRTPDGRSVRLLKILLSSHCIFRCRYCVHRADQDVPRARLAPEELASLVADLYDKDRIDGLFLSSGVEDGPDAAMERMIASVRLLRERHGFRGYIHLKAIPGAAPAQLVQAARLADRLSANVELPTQADLDALAPGRKMADAEEAMGQIRQIRAAGRRRPRPWLPAGQTTQVIVGATPSTDATILHRAAELYAQHRLRRVYYTAYVPIPGADPSLPAVPWPDRLREKRLYQADWLLRSYGFDVAEILAEGTAGGLLRREVDPKLAWALRHRHLFPVDLNRADRALLLRVPGLGPRTADRILAARGRRAVRLADLERAGCPVQRIRPFVVAADQPAGDRRLDREDLERLFVPEGEQLSLFEAPRAA